MSYIERALLMGELTAGDKQLAMRDMTGAEAYNEFVRLVNYIPAADVAPVRHGRWGSNSIAIVCSECGRAFNLVEMFAHYCPWCGALMDGKEDA